MLKNVFPADQLRGLASRRAKPETFRSVRNPLVDEELAKGWNVVKPHANTTRIKKPKSPDKIHEDRVWLLLYRMGFKYLSGEGGAFLTVGDEPESPENQIDVVAIDDEVAFAIECKSSSSPKKFSDFSADLAKLTGLKERFERAVKSSYSPLSKVPSVFAFWTSNLIVTDSDTARADAQKVVMLDDKDKDYYEQLVSQVGSAARFQFLADVLQNRQIPGLELTVPAIRSKIAGTIAYNFTVSPEYFLKIAFVSHRARGAASDIDAYQRLLKKNRLRAIARYISDGGFFPTNIVVNVAKSRWLQFDRSKQEEADTESTVGWLRIRPAYRVAWIIDGQHRLFAYANHPLASKSLISVMAFVGLAPSEQARLFVDINAEQKKVKQSLLEELYAELHWDAAEPEVRTRAILSKVVQSLDVDLSSPLRDRILKADDTRTETRCISFTSVFKALERSEFFIERVKKGAVSIYGPLWANKNERTVKRTLKFLSGYFDLVRSQATEVFDKGAGEGGGLAMNDGITVCINVLRSIVSYFESKAPKTAALIHLSDDELIELIAPLATLVGQHFGGLTADQMAQFRALRGVQGQTTGTRRVEEFLRRNVADFDPPGLKEYLARERAQTTTKAFEEIQTVEKILQFTVLSELKSEYGDKETEWFFGGVPIRVRKKVDDRINEQGGKSGGREQNFDVIDYREIVSANWELFEKILGRGEKGSKEKRTKWISDVNELRQKVMHASKGQSLPITEEQLAILEDTREWLQHQVSEPPLEVQSTVAGE